MFFPEKKSSLVRLSDSVKGSLDRSAALSLRILELYAPHRPVYRRLQDLSRSALDGRLEYDSAEQQIQTLLLTIPEEVALGGPALQLELHDVTLSTLLMCCLCIEGYANAFAYFILYEKDALRLVADGKSSAADELLHVVVERMSQHEKWQTIVRLAGAQGFDESQPPWQDFVFLLRFRNDIVHPKIEDFRTDSCGRRYNRNLPDPVFGLLGLRHAMYAASTYWRMVATLHQLTGLPMAEFQKHYNLRPWRDDTHQVELQKIADHYRDDVSPDD